MATPSSVWQSKVLGASHIFARLAKGTNFYTPDIRVNNYIGDQQVDPAAAALPDGGAMVAWSSYRQDGSLWGVYARKMTAAGTWPRRRNFWSINIPSATSANLPFAPWPTAMSSSPGCRRGSVLSRAADVYARVFTAAGVPVTGEFLVSSSHQ